MDLEKIREEIIKKAEGHRKPQIPPVCMEEFEGLSGKEFLDKAYCRLIGRKPVEEEKEYLYMRLFSGDISKQDILFELVMAPESVRFCSDANDIRFARREWNIGEKKRDSFAHRFVRLLSVMKYLLTHKRAWGRIERIREIWDREDKEV